MRLPEIVKEVGKTSEGNRVYVEDYVYTYLFKLKAEDRELPLRAALYGHVCKKGDKSIYLIYGAASVTNELLKGRDEEQVRKEFFEEYELIGYVNIYGSRQEWPGKKNGYYVFYETNEAMQNYLISCYEGNQKQSSLTTVQKSSFSIGDIIKKLFYGGCIIILTIAVTTINDYNKMQGFMEVAAQAVAFMKAGN